MQQVSSPDIQVIDFDLLLNISTANPSITLTNQSLATVPANLDWVFEMYSPSGTPIYKGTFSAPDIDGIWNAPFVRNTGFPKPNNSIEWSGNPYRVVVKVKDSAGNIFSYEKTVSVCKPSGWKPENKNSYGKAVVNIVTKCQLAKLWVEDRTNYSYNGKEPIIVSKDFKLLLPPDDTGTIPAPKELSNFSSGLINISQAGPGYQYFLTSVMDYNFGNRITVRVKYLDRNTLTISCNIDLSPIACELEKLMLQYEKGSCRDMNEADKMIRLVAAKLNVAIIGIMQPTSGIDPYKVVEEIKTITGWQCDCCSSGMTTLAALDEGTGLSFILNATGGDVNGNFTNDGPNFTLNLFDKSYVFQMCAGNTSAAFTITPSVLGTTKTYCLNVNVNTLADELLTRFEASTVFKNRLITMVAANMSAGNMRVNIAPRCLPLAGAAIAYKYDFETEAGAFIDGNERFFVKYFEKADSTKVLINFDFDQANVADLVTKLNALGLGTWTATFVGDKLKVSSDNNVNDITALVGHFSSIGGPNDYTLVMTKKRLTTTAYPVDDVFQALIDFTCSNMISRIKLGVGLTVQCLSAVGGAITKVDFASTENLSDFMQRFVECFNNLVNIIKNLQTISCDTIKNVFVADDGNIENTDVIYGNFGGRCAYNTPEAIAMMVFKQAQTKQTVKDAMCAVVSNCAKAICAPVENAVVTYDSGASTLTVVITNTGAPKYRLGYARKPRISALLGRPIISGMVEINATPGATTTHVFNGVTSGSWKTYIWAKCNDGSESAEYVATSAECDAPASMNVTFNSVTGNFEVVFGAMPAGAVKKRVEIDYPNGGNFAQNYTLATDPVLIPKPAGVFGTFLFYGLSVCHEANQWYSDRGLPASVKIDAPNACPPPLKVEFLSIGTNSASIRVTKPVGTIQGISLLLTPQNGSAPIKLTLNPPGDTVTFNVPNLTPNTTYGVEAITECAKLASESYNAGTFATQSGGAQSSSITNNGPIDATSASVMINGVLIHVAAPLNSGITSNFSSSNYTNATVKVIPCDTGSTNCSINIGGAIYNPTSQVGETFIFENVLIDDNMQIEFS